MSIRFQNIFNDLKNLKDFFDFSNPDKNPKLTRNKNKKVVIDFEVEAPVFIWIDELICVRSRTSSFICNDKNTNKLKGVSESQWKKFMFEEYYSCLFGSEYQKYLQNFYISLN